MDIDSDPYREVIDLSRIETIDVDSPYDAYEAKAAGSAQASGSSDRSKGSEETTDPAQLAATKRLNHMEVFYKGRLVHGEKISRYLGCCLILRRLAFDSCAFAFDIALLVVPSSKYSQP